MAWLKPVSAYLVLAALLPQPARAERWSFQQVVDAFQRHGFTVLGDHPRCAERGLYGLHLRESRRIVVCPRGNRVETLLHEGWHPVMARRDPAAYVRLVDELCPLPVVPPAAASPERVPKGQAEKRTGS